MKSDLRVAAAPPKPLMVFDGDCSFCTLWIRRWQQCTGDSVDYLPAQDPRIQAQFPEIPARQFQDAVQLIEPDGAIYAGAEAVFRALARSKTHPWLQRCYGASPAFASFAERGYRFIARRRPFFSRLTRWGWGRQVERPTHFLVRWLFLRGMGLVYLIAFLSLWSQIQGLIGSHGIWPAQQLMAALDHKTTAMKLGSSRYYLAPTLCWFNVSDGFLNLLCAAGALLSVLLIAGVAPAPCLFLLWLTYLSLARVGHVFLGYQWDNLLLETGFLAVFLAPLQLWPRPSREPPPSRLMLWLLRWLLFRLMFESGCAKLFSGDEMWRQLTALTVHYETQPLPTWIGWYAHQLPPGFHQVACFLMFVVELAVPFLFFAPRRLRFFGGAATGLLQLAILLTGNYTFFNSLTLLLCLTLLDDSALSGCVPGRLRRLFDLDALALRPPPRPRWRGVVTIPLAALVVTISMLELGAMFGVNTSLFFPVTYGYFMAAPFRSVNRYGLFAAMTRPRYEIVVEGSNDGVTWLPYEFKYKPGDVKRRPAFVAPHQPRLDWQMWFAALGNYRQNPWFVNFGIRLLQGSPEVLALLEKNPFPDKPPRYLRANTYEYHFTNFAGRRATGAWWKREWVDEYLPPFSLSDLPAR